MKKYHSSSSYSNYEAVIASLMFLGIGYAVFSTTESIYLKIISIIIPILLIILIVLYRRKKTFDIFFNEDKILVDYFIIKEKHEIAYKDLLEITYISAHKSPIMNRIKFRKNKAIKSLKFTSVAYSDEYIAFIKWLKSKNENIEISVFPSDNMMNHKIQEVYGFNYRKILKKTL